MVKKMGILLILLSIFICPSLWAKSSYQAVFIGNIKVGKEAFIYKQQRYNLYEVKGQLYLSLGALRQMGVDISDRNGIVYLKESIDEKQDEVASLIILEGEEATMYPLPLYCGNIRSYTLKAQDEWLVPLEALKAIWQIKYDNEVYWQDAYLQNPLELVLLDEEGIENQTDHLMSIQCVHLYWNGTDYETLEEKLLLEGNERKAWGIEPDKQYITTYLTEMNELPIHQADETAYGQRHLPTFKQYSESIRYNELQSLFPSSIILAQMKYNIGPFKEKQQVELCRSEKHLYLLVKNQDGQKYQVPYNSVHILGEKGVYLTKVSDTDIEAFATLSHIESPTDYLLWTDIYRQRTYVLKKEEDQWHLEKKMICSTGKDNNPTPTGFYEVQYMIPYIGVDKGYRCKYALVFFRDYMYHSILFDKTGQYVKSGQYELGSKASHGCVRLSEKDSAWLYKHVPVKSTVWIR